MYKDNTMRISARKLAGLFIMAFSFMGGYSFFTGNTGSIQWYFFYYGRFILMMLYASYSFAKMNKKIDRAVVRWIGKAFTLPLVLMLFYSVFLWILYQAQFRYITRGISDFVFMMGSYISGILLAKAFGKDALRLGLMSAIITMFISFIIGIVSLKGSFFSKMIEGNNIYVEMHEALFVIGLYLIVFMFREKFFENRRNKWLFFLGILLFLIGGKRIGFLAIVITSIFGTVLKRKKNKKITTVCSIAGWIILFISIIYTWISVSGALDVLFVKYAIDMSGRGVLYRYFRRFCEYTPLFLGHGMGFVGRTFTYTTSSELYNMASVKALHNDFFKIYIELGFIGSICWAFYWIKRFPKRIEKRFDCSMMLICFCLLMYSFITYTTDNTEGYFNFQLHLAMLITSLALAVESKKSRQPALFYSEMNDSSLSR